MESETISTTEARKRLSCTSQTIRNLIKGGKLEAVQLENGRFMINLESLQTYQQNNGKKALVAKEAKQRPNNLPISRPFGSSNSGLVQQFRALFAEWIIEFSQSFFPRIKKQPPPTWMIRPFVVSDWQIH